MSFLNRILGNTERSPITSLTSDLKPDNWATFYLFYFNQGIGSDASFRKDSYLVHLLVGNILSEQNNATILNAIDKLHEHAAGEFMHILTKLSDNDIAHLKISAGAALKIFQDSGKATSVFFQNQDEIKGFIANLRTKGAIQV